MCKLENHGTGPSLLLSGAALQWEEAGPRKFLENNTGVGSVLLQQRNDSGVGNGRRNCSSQVAEDHHPPHGSIDSSKGSGAKTHEFPSKPLCYLGKEEEKLGSGEMEKEVTGTAEQKA